MIGSPATAVLGYVGQHYGYRHGIAFFSCTFALAAVLVLFARIVFFKRDRIAG